MNYSFQQDYWTNPTYGKDTDWRRNLCPPVSFRNEIPWSSTEKAQNMFVCFINTKGTIHYKCINQN
jgi:hypothetical protein